MKRLDTRRPVSADERDNLASVCETLCADAKTRTRGREETRARFCAESPYGFDGVRRTRRDGLRVAPFQGAANNAVRWADMVADCERSLILEMARKAERRVRPISGGEESDRRAAALTRLLDWGLSHMGGEWGRQLTLAVNYMLIDTPGVALLSIDWERRPILGPRRATREATFQAMLAADPTLTADELLLAIEDDALDDRMTQAASAVLGSDLRTAELALKAFASDDEVEFAAVLGMDEGPAVRAWQFGTDFAIPDRCPDLSFASPWFRAEWVSEARLLDLSRANDWSEDFVDAALEHKGQSAASFESSIGTDRREMIHLVWAYTIEAGDDGTLARWQTVFCAAPGVTACGRELTRGHRGRWPAVFLARERNSDSLLDSRGLAMLASPAMDLAKKLTDTGSNNAIVGGLPPLVMRGTDSAATLNPLEIIRIKPNSELKFLQPPTYPAQGNNEVVRLKQELLEYFGLATKDGDPDAIGIRRRNRMAAMLEALRDVLSAVLSSIQANASDELLLQVLGKDATDPDLRRDIEGAYRLTLEVNVEDLITKNVIEKVQAFGQILGPLDRQRQVDTAPILRAAIRALFPDVGEEALRNVDDAAGRDLKEEQENFVKIKAGLRPEMNTEGGWNYEVRLAFWQEQLQTNPAAFEEMSPEAQAFAQEWMRALEQQVRQYGANAELGRTGSPAVMPEA